MTPSIQLSQWLQFIDGEYLKSFIHDGGSAIKFAVPLDDASRADIFGGLEGLAVRAGYTTIKISAAETKIHLMDEIFFRTAQQIPWQLLSRRFVAKLAAESGYVWTGDGDGPLHIRLAERNQVDPQMLLLDLKKAISTKVLNEPKMSRDFRFAMTQLCIAELSGGQDGAATVGVLIDWLTGSNKAISAVKPYHIFRKINRTTARLFFESMVRWLRLTAAPGLAVLLDTERLMAARRSDDAGLFYSKAAVLDSYELLRQFIDGMSNLEGFFMVVVPDVSFFEDPSRGIGAYQALKFRVFDEIHDRNLVNPMASLARMSAAN